VGVNTTLVVEEIFIDGEGSLDGSVGEDLLLDVLDSSNAVSGDTLSKVGVVVAGELAVALNRARGGLGNLRRAGILGIRDVMVARLEEVRLAVLVLSIQVAGDQTVVDPVEPSGRGVSTVASHTAGETTARQQVLR